LELSSPLLVAITLGVTKCRVKEWTQVDHFWPLRNHFLPVDFFCEYLRNGKVRSLC